nr:hypothetical protein [Tanacetum cinerariifolium]
MKKRTSPSTGQFSWSFIDSKLFYRTFNDSNLFSRSFNTLKLFFGTFNTSKLLSGIFQKRRVLKLQALAWKDMVLKVTVDMYMYSEQHTVDSAALLHEDYNDM